MSELPEFGDSPALKYFPDGLLENGKARAEDIVIYFNVIEEPKVRFFDVTVSYYPIKRMKELGYDDHIVHKEQNSMYSKARFDKDSGAFCPTWLSEAEEAKIIRHDGTITGYLKTGVNPAIDMALFSSAGFLSEEDAQRALDQFANIDGYTFEMGAKDMVKPYTDADYKKYYETFDEYTQTQQRLVENAIEEGIIETVPNTTVLGGMLLVQKAHPQITSTPKYKRMTQQYDEFIASLEQSQKTQRKKL